MKEGERGTNEKIILLEVQNSRFSLLFALKNVVVFYFAISPANIIKPTQTGIYRNK